MESKKYFYFCMNFSGQAPQAAGIFKGDINVLNQRLEGETVIRINFGTTFPPTAGSFMSINPELYMEITKENVSSIESHIAKTYKFENGSGFNEIFDSIKQSVGAKKEE